MRVVLFISMMMLLIGCKESTDEKPIIGIETSHGMVKIELYPDKPRTRCIVLYNL